MFKRDWVHLREYFNKLGIVHSQCASTTCLSLSRPGCWAGIKCSVGYSTWIWIAESEL